MAQYALYPQQGQSKAFDSLLSPVEAMIPTSPVPIKATDSIEDISVNEKARIAISITRQTRNVWKEDPNPLIQGNQRPDHSSLDDVKLAACRQCFQDQHQQNSNIVVTSWLKEEHHHEYL